MLPQTWWLLQTRKRTNVGFAGGAGVQFKMGSLAVRGEYERFNAARQSTLVNSWDYLEF